uniref:Uncharacterized protein n=1 Tax=viral metagenome TaxID=1070528 RepID=A0A6C0CIT7_9ZZZZ
MTTQQVKQWFCKEESFWCDKWDEDLVEVYTYDEYVERLKKKFDLSTSNEYMLDYVDFHEMILDEYNIMSRRMIMVYATKEGKFVEMEDVGKVYPEWKLDEYTFYNKEADLSKIFIIKNYNNRDE